MVQGKITEADAPTTLHHRHFHTESPFCQNPPIYPGLGQAPNNAGWHTQWLG